jgi:branched-chain amino acid transport system ATP-binding protein
LLDEPTEGLAPVIVKQISHALKALKAEGYTVLLVEQNLSFVGRLSRPALRDRRRTNGRSLVKT